MSKNVSWMTMLGQVSSFLGVLLKAVQELGGSESDLNAAASDPEKMRSLAALIMGKAVTPVLTPVTATFKVTVVDLVTEFEELKRQFDWVNDDFAKAKFEPIDGCPGTSIEMREVEFVYVHLDRDASDADVLAEHERQGVRPATLPELLAFAAKYPDEQRKFPIVARGSVSVLSGYRGVAYLNSDDRERNLNLNWIDDNDWNRNYRFLAVRNSFQVVGKQQVRPAVFRRSVSCS